MMARRVVRDEEASPDPLEDGIAIDRVYRRERSTNRQERVDRGKGRMIAVDRFLQTSPPFDKVFRACGRDETFDVSVTP